MKKNSGILTFFLSIFIFGFLIFKPVFSQDASLLPNAVQQFFDSSGKPLASGKVYFYQVGTSTFKDIYNSSAATTPYTNPITLNAGGKPPGGSGIYGIGLYRQLVKDKNGNTIWDAVTAPGGSGGSTPTAVGDGNLVGTTLPWSGLVAPNQYVFAYGQEISRTIYPEFYTAITLQANVICTASSNTLTGLADTSQIPIGAPIELALCVPPGSTVISKTSGSVTLNNPSNVSLNATARFFPYGNGNGSTTFNVPDLRSVVLAGRPNMGGSDRGLLTTAYYGTNPAALGALGGSQTSTLTQANLPVSIGNAASTVTDPGHTHIQNVSSGAGAQPNPVGGGNTGTFVGSLLTGSSLTGITVTTVISNANGGFAHAIVQPTLTFNYIIKVTPDTPISTTNVVTSLGGMTGVISCGTGLTCADQTISVNSFGEATTAIKIPVKVATTANIGLFGAQTIDGVSVVDGDRVLVKDQVTASENGIYVVSNSNWTRATDFNETSELTQGTLIYINQGSTQTNYIYRISTVSPTIGSNLNFSLVTGFANPSNQIGLTAINGSATTAMRSDAAPAINQSISPTWLSIHTFQVGLNLSGSLSGNTKLQASSAASGTITFPAATDTVALLATAQALTNKTYNGLTVTNSTGTLTVSNGKTITQNNTLTYNGTDGSTISFGTGGTVTYTIATGTAALGTSAISALSCATVVTVSATGTATTDVLDASFNSDPTGVTGYTPGAMLSIISYPTSNNVNFKVCNNTSSTITPSNITLNWKVRR